MEIQRLIKLANNIGAFFEVEPDRTKGARDVANHIKSFWDPRMRRELLQHLDSQRGDGLSALVLSALQTHRQELAPRS
jgi:formate dehydrogenase subunit delta